MSGEPPEFTCRPSREATVNSMESGRIVLIANSHCGEFKFNWNGHMAKF